MAKRQKKQKTKQIEKQEEETILTPSIGERLENPVLENTEIDNPVMESVDLCLLAEGAVDDNVECVVSLEPLQPEFEIVVQDVVSQITKEFHQEDKVQLFSLEEAAHTLLEGFKDHWLPGIRVRCTLLGKNPMFEYSLNEWKELFMIWGGSHIIKK